MINTTISRVWVLRVGDFLLGIEPKPFKEVLEVVSPTPVPLAPAALIGLLSNQGNIVAVFDLGPSLNLKCQNPSLAALVENQGQMLAFCIDEVVGLRSHLNGTWISASENPVFSATLELENRPVQILDVAKLFEHLSTQMGFISLKEPVEALAQA